MTTDGIRPGDGLSDGECEELLAGRRADLPVGAMLQSLGGPLAEELPGEAAAMAAFRSAAAGGTAPRAGRVSARIAAIGVGGSVVLIGGVAAAASGQLRHDLHDVFVKPQPHHSAPAHRHHGPTPSLPTLAPSAPSSSPTSISSPGPGSQHGKAHGGHGQGAGVGETTAPTHPAHPTKPAHPTNKPHPTTPAHPTNKPHPTTPAHPTNKPHPTKPARPTRSSSPTPSATATKNPHPTHTPKNGDPGQPTHGVTAH